MLLFPPPYTCCKWKNTISKPNPAEKKMSLTHKTPLVYITWVIFYSGEKGTLYKEMQACGVVTHPGFLWLALPCLSLSRESYQGQVKYLPYEGFKKKTTNKRADKTFYRYPSLNCGSFLNFILLLPWYFLHCCVLITT